MKNERSSAGRHDEVLTPDAVLTPKDLERIPDRDLRRRVADLVTRCERHETLQRERDDLRDRVQHLELNYHLARQIAQFKSGFLSRISHELRSPLNGSIGALQLILADLCEDRDEEREFIGKAHESALKLVEILDTILKVARAEQGRTPLKLESVRLAEVFEDIRRLTHLQAANRNYKLYVERPDPTLAVRADFKLLVQISVDLIEKSIDGMNEGSLRLSAISLDRTVSLCLDSPCPWEAWSDPIETMSAPLSPDDPRNTNCQLSHSLTLLLDRTLIDLMSGDLEILEAPTDGDSSWITRIRCSLPRAFPASETD
ncbi:MAG: HAMP domain-containing histidine kinase [Cyanobacteria bacterium SID2]|nr:HAMP domain-containing histidine kinase [Cyanobacteria bacterium SID2]